MALIAKIGCSAMIDASGAGTFASQVKKDGSALGADLQMSSDSSEAPKKKTKRYEIEFGREKLAAKCREESDEAVKQGLAAVAKAEGTLQVSEDVEGIVTGMSRLRQVLSTRVEYLKQALASSDGQKPFEFTGNDDEELNAIEDILTGVSLVLVGGSYAEDEKQTHLTALFKSMELPRAKCVALCMGFALGAKGSSGFSHWCPDRIYTFPFFSGMLGFNVFRPCYFFLCFVLRLRVSFFCS